MKLSPRLQCIAEKVNPGSYIADIGTDHAYLPIYLIENGICIRAIATDVRRGPLDRAWENIKANGLLNKIELRLGYGLSPIGRDEVDCAVLAGMGGYLICNILDEGRRKAESIKYFIIQPVQAPEVVREYLYKNKYTIYDEQLVKEKDKIYEIIAAAHGEDSLIDPIYCEIGRKLIEKKDPLLPEFISLKIEELKKVIGKIGRENSANARTRLAECKAKLKSYEGVLKCL